MTHEEIKTRLAEITAEIMQISDLPEDFALIYIYADGNRVKPFVCGNGYVLHQMLKACAQNSDDFRGMLADVVEDLNG